VCAPPATDRRRRRRTIAVVAAAVLVTLAVFAAWQLFPRIRLDEVEEVHYAWWSGGAPPADGGAVQIAVHHTAVAPAAGVTGTVHAISRLWVGSPQSTTSELHSSVDGERLRAIVWHLNRARIWRRPKTVEAPDDGQWLITVRLGRGSAPAWPFLRERKLEASVGTRYAPARYVALARELEAPRFLTGPGTHLPVPHSPDA
jgi:hypothetical protein